MEIDISDRSRHSKRPHQNQGVLMRSLFELETNANDFYCTVALPKTGRLFFYGFHWFVEQMIDCEFEGVAGYGENEIQYANKKMKNGRKLYSL